MHRLLNPLRNERGIAIVMAAFSLFILCGLCLGMLFSSVSAHKSTQTRKKELETLYIAEAGISRSIAEITSRVDVVGDGLGTVNGNINGGTYSVVAVDNGNMTFTVTSDGDHSESERAIQATLQIVQNSPFKSAIFGDMASAVTGGSFCDSYDSTNGTYASQAVNVDPVTGIIYAGDNGDVGSNGNIWIDYGTSIIGDATPGQGCGVFGMGYISGSIAPASEATVLRSAPYDPTIPSSGDYVSRGNQIFTAGAYHYGNFNTNDMLTFQGEVTMYVGGDIALTGSAEIVLDPGATLKIYHNGTNLTLLRNIAINTGGNPADFQVYSNCSVVHLEGHFEYNMGIYAPNADVTMLGRNYEYFGSCVGKAVNCLGKGNFHYDEALGRLEGPVRELRVISWREVSPS
jgi:hypothetical protein